MTLACHESDGGNSTLLQLVKKSCRQMDWAPKGGIFSRQGMFCCLGEELFSAYNPLKLPFNRLSQLP